MRLFPKLFSASAPPSGETPETWLCDVEESYRDRLLSMYRGETQLGSDGEQHAIDGSTRISPQQGMWGYELCRATKPERTLEIGMAYGFSTLYFLAALAKNGHGEHTSIDPFQQDHWKGIGLTHATTMAATTQGAVSFTHRAEFSDRAAADFLREPERFDVIFIDGNHRFDDVLVDFYLYSQLCNVGGHILLDDMWMGSVRTVTSFIRTNRSDFVEVETPVENLSVFKKVAEDSRKWDHFLKFSVSSRTNAA